MGRAKFLWPAPRAAPFEQLAPIRVHSRPFAVEKKPEKPPKTAKNRHARISPKKHAEFCAKKCQKVPKSATLGTPPKKHPRFFRIVSTCRFVSRNFRVVTLGSPPAFTGFVLLSQRLCQAAVPACAAKPCASPPADKCLSHTPVHIRSAGTCLHERCPISGQRQRCERRACHERPGVGVVGSPRRKAAR